MKRSNGNKVNSVLKLTVIYAVLMLIILVASLFFAFRSADKGEAVTVEKHVQTEYVYIVKDELQEDATETSGVKLYTVREHMGKIGVFEEDGTLYKVIDVYVKNLPEADKRLLGEGFWVEGDKELNAVIEDYDG